MALVERIRWGILGCGNVCEVKSGPAFQNAQGSQLVAVMRRDRALAEDFARRHGVPKAYADADALIADPNVDAVYVATPPGHHLELALRVAAAGKPAYVEKPMARNHDECVRLVEAFERAGQPLFVAYYRRALPRFVKTKQLIESGAIGTLRSVDVRYTSPGQLKLDSTRLPWRVQAEHSGGGLFLDLASHTLDVLDFLLGPLQQVSGEAVNRVRASDVEDQVALRFSTRDGALGVVSFDFTRPEREDVIHFVGSDGTLSVSTFGDTPIELQARSGQERFTFSNPTHIQQPLIQSIVDQLLGHGACPSTGVSAARTSRVIDQALAGYYGGREGGFWEHPERWPGRHQSVSI